MDKNKNKLIVITFVLALIFIGVIFLFMKDNYYEITVSGVEKEYVLKTNKDGYIEDINIPKKDGYLFVGWFVDDEEVDFSKPFNKNVVVTAKWEKIIEDEDDEDNDLNIDESIVLDNVDSEIVDNNDGDLKLEKVYLSYTNLILNVNDKKKLSAYVEPVNCKYKSLVWKSSDSSVVKVDKYGNLVALAPGQAKITITIDNISSSCIVTVRKNYTKNVVWEKVEDTSIEQYRLFIVDSNNKKQSGTVQITTITGKVFEEKISVSGSENVYIKSTIESVIIK